MAEEAEEEAEEQDGAVAEGQQHIGEVDAPAADGVDHEVAAAADGVGQVGADEIAAEGAGRADHDVAAGAGDAEVADGAEVGGEPEDDGVAAALDAEGEHGGEEGAADHVGGEDLEGCRAVAGGCFGFEGAGEEGGLGDVAANVDHEEGRQEADEEDGAPGDVGRQGGEDGSGDGGGGEPADGEGALDAADGLAAVLRADDLAHEDGAGGPFAAEAQALEGAEDQKLIVGLGEAAETGEDRVPDYGALEHADPAVAVGQGAGDPAADGGGDEGGGADDAALVGADVERQREGGDEEGKQLHIHGVERPAAEAAPEGAAFAGGEFFVPGEHQRGANMRARASCSVRKACSGCCCTRARERANSMAPKGRP